MSRRHHRQPPALGVTVSTPIISPVAGTYSGSVTVSVTCETAGATICYTLNGTTPATSSPAYTAPITLTQSATIKVQAYAVGMTPSSVVSRTYVSALPRVTTPTLTPGPGTYVGSVKVTLTCATAGVTIYYTLGTTTGITYANGVYTGPLTFTQTTGIRVWATKNGMLESLAVTGTYTITSAPVAPPLLDPPQGVIVDSIVVHIGCITVGATLRYTTDGSEPTAASPAYAEPLTFTAATTLKVRGFKDGLLPSGIVTGVYTK